MAHPPTVPGEKEGCGRSRVQRVPAPDSLPRCPPPDFQLRPTARNIRRRHYPGVHDERGHPKPLPAMLRDAHYTSISSPSIPRRALFRSACLYEYNAVRSYIFLSMIG